MSFWRSPDPLTHRTNELSEQESIGVNSPIAITVSAVFGATAVILGAYGAHGLENLLVTYREDPEWLIKRLDTFEVGVRYHLTHAVAMLALSLVGSRSIANLKLVMNFFVAGVLLFSGSLYLLVFLDLPIMGAITPLGGLSLIIAWLLIVVGAWKARAKS